MSRANKRDTEIRATLEGIGTELAVIRRVLPVHTLRLEQTWSRTGLGALLGPALEETSTINAGIEAIGAQVKAALRMLEQG